MFLLFFGWVAFCYKYKQLDFSNKIYSLTFPRPKKSGRILGNVQPYYKKQLRYNNALIVQNETALAGGTIITGSSGSGKTISIIEMIRQDLASNKSVCFFNFKGDKETEEQIENMIDAHQLYKLNYDSVNFSYDPLKNLDNAGRTEAILNMRAWAMDSSDAHYKTGVQLLLQKTLNDFEYSTGNFLLEYYKWLKNYNPEKTDFDSYATVIKLLELTIESQVKEMFGSTLPKFSFTSDKPFCLLVSFTSATKALATSVTSLMLKDLMEVGTKTPYTPSLHLYIDEFGSCESPLIVKDILEKGRSCGICTTISMQDLNQLIINTNAPFLDSVLGTVNSYIVFAGSTRDTAQKISGTQIHDIDNLLMSLRKPTPGKPPTAIFISKYPIFRAGGTEVYRFVPLKQKRSSKMTSNDQSHEDTIKHPDTAETTLKMPEDALFEKSPKNDENTPSLDVDVWL